LITIAAPPRLSVRGQPLDTSDHAFGELRRTPPGSGQSDLPKRLDDDGYLYLPGYLSRGDVLATRRDLLARFAALGCVAPDTPLDDAVPGLAASRLPRNALARESAPLQQLLYGDSMTDLFERLLSESTRHFDVTWLRAYPPGWGSDPHMDSVFMNRGSPRLLTAWIPIGDIDMTLGGLLILEGSHRLEDVKRDYASRDVDEYCANYDDAAEKAGRDFPAWDGTLSDDAIGLRSQLGLRWLTADFRAGDVLVFTMYTVHAGLDNNGDRIRLSCDSRWQPAAEPIDERFVGESPAGYSSGSKRPRIC
jgi:Phytanoyl-CoA dioxygenase (PhyH)